MNAVMSIAFIFLRDSHSQVDVVGVRVQRIRLSKISNGLKCNIQRLLAYLERSVGVMHRRLMVLGERRYSAGCRLVGYELLHFALSRHPLERVPSRNSTKRAFHVRSHNLQAVDIGCIDPAEATPMMLVVNLVIHHTLNELTLQSQHP